MGAFRSILETLRSSLWFIPSVLVLGAIVLAFSLIVLDSFIGQDVFRDWPLLFGAGADGAREVLSAIAGSMITVAGVTFSITIVALSLTASQYSSRVLRNFMRDRANQAVLGAFVAVFAYCLVVLRVIRSGSEDPFVPETAVLMGVIMALGAIALLVYFIHHIASSIQAVAIIAAASRETRQAIDRLFPDELRAGQADEASEFALPPAEAWHVVPALYTGYLQGVDINDLLNLAESQQGIVRMERKIGEFVVQGTRLASLASDRPPGEGVIQEVNAAYIFDIQRNVYQDPSFGIQQLVDIALKGLSPGINDTTTAVISIDHLSSVLARAAPRCRVSDYRCVDGKLRVIAEGVTFSALVSAAFDQVRRNSEGNVAALLRLFDSLTTIAEATRDPRRRMVLREQAQLIWKTADRSVTFPYDHLLLAKRRDRVLAELAGGFHESSPAGDSTG